MSEGPRRKLGSHLLEAAGPDVILSLGTKYLEQVKETGSRKRGDWSDLGRKVVCFKTEGQTVFRGKGVCVEREEVCRMRS